MNITLEQRNAQKLHNLINVANQFVMNRDIYFFIKNNVKNMINQVKIPTKDYEILSGHIQAFNNELSSSNWDPRQFDPNKYDKFLNDFYSTVDFKKISNEFMFKCKDLLEISPVKNDLYRRRMEFFDKKLPKISQFHNTTTKPQMQNNNMHFNKTNTLNTHNTLNTKKVEAQPVNPFEGMNNNSPYGNCYGNNNNNNNNYPYDNIGLLNNQCQINNNNNERAVLRGQNLQSPLTMNKNNINNNNMISNNMMEYRPKKIPENMKSKIIQELQKISEEIGGGKIDVCRRHAVETVLLFKQIFPYE